MSFFLRLNFELLVLKLTWHKRKLSLIMVGRWKKMWRKRRRKKRADSFTYGGILSFIKNSKVSNKVINVVFASFSKLVLDI